MDCQYLSPLAKVSRINLKYFLSFLCFICGLYGHTVGNVAILILLVTTHMAFNGMGFSMN